MGSKAKSLRDGLLIAALSVVLLAAVELTIRLAHRLGSGVWPETRMSRFYGDLTTAVGLYRRHPYLNVAPRESARVRAFGKEASFNSLGYRSPERSLEKPDNVVRILCAGGSTTFDILAARDEASWPWLLEERLRARGVRVEVWNAGFPGWTSLENLISLAIRDRDLQPDWIVLYQGINDLQPASHNPFDRQYEKGHADSARRTLGFDLESPGWHGKSLLLETLQHWIWGPTNPWQAVNRPRHATPPTRTVPPAAVAIFERNLRSFAALSRDLGARLLLVPQTLRLRDDHGARDRTLLTDWLPGLEPDAAATALEQLNAVEQRLAGEGVARAAGPDYSDWPDTEWDDAMHFSRQGSERFATFLDDFFSKELIGAVKAP